MNALTNQYEGKLAVITTKHEKGRLVQPAFSALLNMAIQEIDFDTDTLGTFSGEVERVGTQLETAIKKARLGMSLSGNPYGIASEGSVGPDPHFIFISANIETMVFIDDTLGIEVIESYKSNDIVAAITSTEKDNLTDFLLRADFPNHALIVKANKGQGVVKGIRDLNLLHTAIKEVKERSLDGEAIIESDFRAMSSPSRQKNISTLALKLANRLTQSCPDCSLPGWGLKTYSRGVECSGCGEISPNAVRQELLGCVKCEYTALGTVINSTLDPSQCMACNP